MSTNDLKYDLFIYHDHCMDGLTAVAIALQTCAGTHGVDERVTIIPGSYGTPLNLKKLKGKRVCFLDFSAKLDVMLDILEVAEHVTVMDHHISIHADLMTIDSPKFTYIYDVELSGAEIAWREFIGTKQPYFIDLIGARDLWKKEYRDADILQLALKVGEYDVDSMFALIAELIEYDDVTANATTTELIANGNLYQKYHNQIVEQIASKAFRSELDDGTPVMKVNCTQGFVSDVGQYLYNRYEDVAWMFTVGEDKVYHSLRVSASSDYDASAYAKSKGGGGHVKACGWVTDL